MNPYENNGNGFYMPVAPAYGGGYGNGSFGYGGDLIPWLFLFAMMNGGWGFGGMGGWGGMMGMGMMDGMWSFPWLFNGQNNINNNTNAGFRDAALNDGINGIRSNLADISTQICNGFNGAEIAANGRQMADMQQNFALQREIAGVDASIAREACATRANSTQNTQSILNVITGGIQSIKDQLCQDKIDAKDDIIAQLRQENLYARGQASQVEQTARILAGQAAEIDGVYNRLKNCPVGAVPVFGNQPIFTCAQNVAGSCGCNGNGFFN
jgi:hypothetical protein